MSSRAFYPPCRLLIADLLVAFSTLKMEAMHSSEISADFDAVTRSVYFLSSAWDPVSFFAVYLTTLSLRRIVGLRKGFEGFCMEGLGKTMATVSQDGSCSHLPNATLQHYH
jgi:hypothetical protein